MTALKVLRVVRFVGRVVIPPCVFIAIVSWMIHVTLTNAIVTHP